MLFSSLISQLPVLAALLGTAAAVDIQAWQGFSCNQGTMVYFSQVEHDTCVKFPLSFGIRFYSVPGGAKGHVYYDSYCKNFAQEGGAGTYCLEEHNNMRSANWFWSSKRLVRREEKIGEQSSGVGYTTPDGSTRRILCSPYQFEHVLELVKAEDWSALEEFPTDPRPAPEED